MPVDFQEEEPIDFVEEPVKEGITGQYKDFPGPYGVPMASSGEPLLNVPPSWIEKAIKTVMAVPVPTWPQALRLLPPEKREQAIQGISESVAGGLSSLTSPPGIGMAVAAPVAPALIGGAAAVMGASQLPGAIQEVRQAEGPRETARAITDIAQAGGMMLAPLAGLKKPPVPEAPLVTKASEVLPRAAEEVAKPEAPVVEPPVEPPKVEAAEPTPQPEVRTALKQEGLSDQEISDLLAGKASVSEIVGRKLRPFDVEYGGGPEHAQALEEARIQAVSRIENALKAQPEVSYLDEIVEYGGEKMPRGAVIRDLQQRGFDQQAIDRYMQGLDLAKEKGIADAIEERKVQESVQPERLRTAPLGLPAEAGPRDSLQPAAPQPKAAEVLLKPDEAAAPVKMQSEVSKVAATEGKRSAKEIKEDLIAELQDRLAKAPSEAKPGDKVTIEIPGDGVFTIPNTVEALSLVLERAKKLKTDIKPPGVSKKAIKSSTEALRIGARGAELIRQEKLAEEQRIRARDEETKALRANPPWSDYTEGHFVKWLESTVPEVERLDVERNMRGLVKQDPEVLTNRSWPEIRELSKYYEPPIKPSAQTTPAAPAEVPATPPPAGQPAAGAPPAATPPPPGGAAGAPLRPGPGAATGGWTQTAIKTLSDEIARLPKSDARQKISFAEKWAEREARGRDLADRMVLRMAAVGASMKETMRGVRTPTELGNKIGELDYLTQQSTALGQQAKIAMQKAIPSQDMRNGLWLFADAHGDLTAIRDTLANLPADTKPGVRRALESALQLTDREKAWLPFVREYYDIKAQQAEAAGVMDDVLEDYFTHVWKVKDNMPAALQGALNSGRVSEYFQFARERKLPTMLEGIRNPTMIPGKRLEPVLDPADIIPYYNFALDRAIASREFMKALDDLRASDGRPLLAPSGQGKLVTATEFAVVSDRTGRAVNNGIFKNQADAQALAGQTPDTHVEPRQNDFLLIKSKVTPKELAGYQAIDHPSMRKWRWADTGPDGKTVLYEGQLLAHPEAAQRLRNMMDRTLLTPSPVMRAALRYSGEIKAAKLGLLSTFHLIHVGKHAIFHATNPFMPKAIDWESPQVRYAIEKGHLKLAANPSELNAFSEGILANEALVHKIPLIGPWSRALSEWLFTDYIPRLKMATFENALKGQQTGLVRRALQLGARQLSPDELAARVGDSVNSAFGELNQLWLGKNGRSPTLQRILRLAFLAPDFGEARLRFVGKAFTKYGSEERFALLMNAGLIYGLARIANWMVSGDPQSNDLRHAFDVKARIGGKDYWLSMRSVMTDLEHAFTNFSQFVRVRMNPAYSTPLIDFLTGTNWRGQKRTGMQWFQDRLAQLVPISLQSLTTDDQHLWQSLMASMGIQPRRGDAVSEMHERAKSWREVRGIKDSVDVHESSAGNPYRQARIALEFNDARGFWRALQEQSERLRARETKAPMKTIESAFKRYYNAPFSGTKATEPAFLNSLPDRDRKVYQEALRERKRDWDKFQTWWQEHPTMLGQ